MRRQVAFCGPGEAEKAYLPDAGYYALGLVPIGSLQGKLGFFFFYVPVKSQLSPEISPRDSSC